MEAFPPKESPTVPAARPGSARNRAAAWTGVQGETPVTSAPWKHTSHAPNGGYRCTLGAETSLQALQKKRNKHSQGPNRVLDASHRVREASEAGPQGPPFNQREKKSDEVEMTRHRERGEMGRHGWECNTAWSV